MKDVHAGDEALNEVLKQFAGIYKTAISRAMELLTAFLKPRVSRLRPRKNESENEYHLRVMEAFKGAVWAITRRKIASAFTDAHELIMKAINAQLEKAFADGFNAMAYMLRDDGAVPITEEIIRELEKDGDIRLDRRGLTRRKDTAYNEKRLQSAVYMAIILGIRLEKLPEHIARTFAASRQGEYTTTARTRIYSAADSGVYLCGQELAGMGVKVEKTWMSMLDLRVRPSHRMLHNETVPFDGVFHGLYGDLRFPHDPEAPPAETYHCRCSMVVHLAGKKPGKYDWLLKPTEMSAYRKWLKAQISGAGDDVLRLHKRLVRGSQ